MLEIAIVTIQMICIEQLFPAMLIAILYLGLSVTGYQSYPDTGGTYKKTFILSTVIKRLMFRNEMLYLLLMNRLCHL